MTLSRLRKILNGSSKIGMISALRLRNTVFLRSFTKQRGHFNQSASRKCWMTTLFWESQISTTTKTILRRNQMRMNQMRMNQTEKRMRKKKRSSLRKLALRPKLITRQMSQKGTKIKLYLLLSICSDLRGSFGFQITQTTTSSGVKLPSKLLFPAQIPGRMWCQIRKWPWNSKPKQEL